jgi:hypothetical protein
MALLSLNSSGVAYIGIGGGSDSVQAAILALLEGKPACVISIRTAKTTSQGLDGRMGQDRTVSNHGGELVSGVFRIRPETTGSGRFLENLLADQVSPYRGIRFIDNLLTRVPIYLTTKYVLTKRVPTYLVIDAQDGRMPSQIQAVLDDMRDQKGLMIDTLVGVDTGGDALYRTTVHDQSRATPDQDLRSLRCLVTFETMHRVSCIVAKGVDSPPYANDVLRQAEAVYRELSNQQARFALTTYQCIQLDGSNDQRNGKTPFAWQAALRGETGEIRLPLADHLVNHPTNPWNPWVTIGSDTAGIYVMNMEQHLAAL